MRRPRPAASSSRSPMPTAPSPSSRPRSWSRPAPPVRSAASMSGIGARRPSPTSTATATSTWSSATLSAICVTTRTPARPSHRPSAVQTGAANPFDGVDIGSKSAPTFADLDGDGDLDAVVGADAGTLSYFKNTGTAIAPVFSRAERRRQSVQHRRSGRLQHAESSPTSTATATSTPWSGNDGSGVVKYFQNTGSATAPVFDRRPARQSVRRHRCGGRQPRRASPTSTATATSTPSSAKTSAPCTISRTPARPITATFVERTGPPIRSTASTSDT